MEKVIKKILGKMVSGLRRVQRGFTDQNPLKLKLNDHGFRQDTNGFRDLVREVIDKYPVEEIIESGTAHGDGSTMIFAEYELPVVSIECNKQFYEIASKNLKQYSNVRLIHGHSLKRSLTEKAIEESRIFFENPGDVLSDSPDPVAFYMEEVGHDTPRDNVLMDLIDNARQQIIFLDSSGGIGYTEFQHVLGLEPEKLKNKVVLLDDVDHVKHVRSLNHLASLQVPVVLSSDNRSCYFLGKNLATSR